MKNRCLWLFTLLAAVALAAPTSAFASSHREAPAISRDPTADNTDLYAWVTPSTHDKLQIVANWIPLEDPAGGPNFHMFSDNVLYEIHIARGPTSLRDVVTYHIRFRTSRPARVDPADLTAAVGGGKEFFIQLSGIKQTYTVYKSSWSNGVYTTSVLARNIDVAPPNIGPRTNEVAYKIANKKYDDAFAKTFIKPLGNNGDEGRVWAGPRDDGFYVDLGGVFDLANLRAKGTAVDGVAGKNVHSIALEIPTTKLTADGKAPPTDNKASDAHTLGIWASAARRRFTFRLWNGRSFHFGPWVRVSRLGLPLINEAVIGIQDKDRFNAGHPAHDASRFAAYFLNPVVVRDAEAVGIYKALNVPDATVTALKSGRNDIIETINLKASGHDIKTIGDVLRVDMAMDSSFPNGRPLIGGAADNQEQADVTDVLLTVILAKGTLQISDGVQNNDKNFLKEFPWLPLPHEGYSEGQGKVPTP